MRKRLNVQLELAAVPIEKIEIPRSRDEDPPVIEALQWLFCHQDASEEIFELLDQQGSIPVKHGSESLNAIINAITH
jgi:hypothetical protein